MIVCLALDDNNGMLFNNRRQSQDKVLRDNLLNECEGKILWMNEYSAKQFGESLTENVRIDEDFLSKAGKEDYCFVENLFLVDYEDKISRLIIYKWNRVYPADIHFDIPLSNSKWGIYSTEEFIGNSHKIITKEIWIRE